MARQNTAAGGAKAWTAAPRWAGLLEPLLVAALFMTAIAAVLPLSGDHHRELDEGLNLMKAALVANGFSLYTDIWNDQPPVFTYVLATVHRLLGENLAAARLVTLAFAGWTAASLFRIVRRSEGRVAAWTAIITLAGAMAVVRSGATVVIGLPAIAFALAGLDQALAGAERGTRWRFVLAGLLFGMALQTKMFVAIMLPALAIAPFAAQAKLHRSRGTAPFDLALMFAVALAVFLAIALAANESLIGQMLQPHVNAADIPSYTEHGGIKLLARRIRAVLLLGGALGLIAFALRPSLLRAIPVVWLLAAIAILALHRPLWWHHTTLVEIPLAWLAGIAVTLSERLPKPRVAAAWFVALVFSLSAAQLLSLKKSTARHIARQQAFVTAIPREDGSRWFVTDRPIDAYVAGRLMPPELAVFSEKRMRTGNLTSEQIIESIRVRRPDGLLFVRFQHDPAVTEFLEREYERAPPHQQDQQSVSRFIERTVSAPIAAGSSKRGIADALEVVSRNLASRSIGGGYAGHYNMTTGEHFSRPPLSRRLARNQIVVRPPGSTQLVGRCFLRAHQLTGRPAFEALAIAAGKALACTQRSAGGWGEEPRLRESCEDDPTAKKQDRRGEGRMTLDEGATPKAIDFLMDLESHVLARTAPPPAWLAPAVRRSLDALLAIQDRSGGWPQQYPPPEGGRDSYAGHFTFNDEAMTAALTTMLNAYRHYRGRKHLDAAVLAGEFILRTQGPPAQAGWAQQYDAEFRPAPARPFEPAAYSSHESGFVMNALLDLYLATRDERFLTPIAPARAWLGRSEIRPGVWARLYEPGSNRPLYGDRDGVARYDINEISEERRKGYDWEMRFPTVVRAFARHDIALARGADGLSQYDAGPPRPLSAEEKAAVARLLHDAEEKGRWSIGDIISTQAFVDNCNLLLRAIEAPE